jgi:hypothetical protein
MSLTATNPFGAECLPQPFPADQPDAIVTAEQVAAFRHTTYGNLAQERHMGRGPKYLKVGRRVFYRVGDVLDHLATCTIDPRTRERETG